LLIRPIRHRFVRAALVASARRARTLDSIDMLASPRVRRANMLQTSMKFARRHLGIDGYFDVFTHRSKRAHRKATHARLVIDERRPR
jgi:hypothetical protein